jgi:DNA-binding CsgD family transcriptional regulator
VAELSEALSGATDQAFLARDVLPQLRQMLDFDRVGMYSIRPEERALSVELFDFAGVGPRLRQDFDGALRRHPSWTFDPFRPPVRERNRVRTMRPGETGRKAERVPALGYLVERYPWLDGEHELRVLVCDGPALLAWVGGYRGGALPFTPREWTILGSLIGPLGDRLRFERDHGQGKVALAALAASLEEIGSGAFLVTARGRIVQANAAGRALLDRKVVEPGQLAAAASNRHHPRFRQTRLSAPGLPVHYLLVERHAAPEAVQRGARCARRWGLTARQAEVLQHVARGSANKTIAAALGCGEPTVEFHVTALLEKAGCDNRAGLVARFWTED